MDKKQPHEIDLSPDDCWETGSRHPFWTVNRQILAWYVLAGPPVYTFAYWLIKGEVPAFVAWLAQ
jgi:hypothetical protein